MAYLTKYNIGQLCQKLEVKKEISLEMFLENVYNDKQIYFILNKREIRYLFVYKMLIDDEEKFYVEYYQEVPEKADSKNLVNNKGGRMKYHLSSDCKLLTKDYLDFNIPRDIKEQGDKAIDEYREWFRENNFTERYKSKTIDKNTIISAFNSKYPVKYDIKRIEDNSNLLVFEVPNSTNKFLQKDFDLEDFKNKLEELKVQWYNTFQCKVSRTFAKFKYLLNHKDEEIDAKMSEIFSENFVTNYGLENLKEKLFISKEINFKLIDLLLEYIKWTLDINSKEFHSLTLEQFGLECCHSCRNEVSAS